jgi:hypothetical protein
MTERHRRNQQLSTESRLLPRRRALASPRDYELLETEGYGYAIRLPANRVLEDRIGYLLKRFRLHRTGLVVNSRCRSRISEPPRFRYILYVTKPLRRGRAVDKRSTSIQCSDRLNKVESIHLSSASNRLSIATPLLGDRIGVPNPIILGVYGCHID